MVASSAARARSSLCRQRGRVCATMTLPLKQHTAQISGRRGKKKPDLLSWAASWENCAHADCVSARTAERPAELVCHTLFIVCVCVCVLV